MLMNRYDQLVSKLKKIWLTYDEYMEYCRLNLELWKSYLDRWEITEKTYNTHKNHIDRVKEKLSKYNPHIIPREEVMSYDYD